MITSEEKKILTSKFGKDPKNTGSLDVQVAMLTTRIKNLAPHFGDHKHDFHSKRGLMKMIGKRRSLLRYIRNKDENRYLNLIKELGLRK